MLKYLTFNSFILSFYYLIVSLFNIEPVLCRINIHFISLFVMLGGWYITYILKKIKVTFLDYEYTFCGKELIISDMIFHILPFLLVLVFLENVYTTNENVLTILLLIIYFLLNDILKIYDVHTDLQKNEFMYIMLVAVFIYICVFHHFKLIE